MLVVPALLSLKPQCVYEASEGVVAMMEVVTERLNDQSEIVQKTAKKLVVEIDKHYAEHIPRVLEKFTSVALRSEFLEVLGRAHEAASEQSSSFTVNRTVEEEKKATISAEVPAPQRLLGPSSSSMGIHNAYGYVDTRGGSNSPSSL